MPFSGCTKLPRRNCGCGIDFVYSIVSGGDKLVNEPWDDTAIAATAVIVLWVGRTSGTLSLALAFRLCVLGLSTCGPGLDILGSRRIPTQFCLPGLVVPFLGLAMIPYAGCVTLVSLDPSISSGCACLRPCWCFAAQCSWPWVRNVCTATTHPLRASYGPLRFIS